MRPSKGQARVFTMPQMPRVPEEMTHRFPVMAQWQAELDDWQQKVQHALRDQFESGRDGD